MAEMKEKIGKRVTFRGTVLRLMRKRKRMKLTTLIENCKRLNLSKSKHSEMLYKMTIRDLVKDGLLQREKQGKEVILKLVVRSQKL